MLNRDRNIVTLHDLYNALTQNLQVHKDIYQFLPQFFKIVEPYHMPFEPLGDDKFVFQIKDVFTSEIGMKTKLYQIALKRIYGAVVPYNFEERLQIEVDSPQSTFANLYKKIMDPALRHLRFRILHNDIFTHKKMYKLSMTNSERCPNCNSVETLQHQLFDCEGPQALWRVFNNLMSNLGGEDLQVHSFAEAVNIQCNSNTVSETIKSIVLKCCIQIDRPTINSDIVLLRLLLKTTTTEISVLKKRKKPPKGIISRWRKIKSLVDTEIQRRNQ
jgi:hypothetical protein